MRKIILSALLAYSLIALHAQNVGINTTTPGAYGHGGTNRLLEIKNDAGTGANFQSHLILSSTGSSGSLGSVTWAAPNITGTEKRTALIANIFETANATRLAFYTRNDAGSLIEKLTILGNGNAGIGTTTPRAPLSFPATTGQKITLWDDGNTGGNSYGIGVQSGMLQIHSYTSTDDIVFGYGKSTALTERMRIINSGADGLVLNGRITLKNGTSPVDQNYSGGIWVYKADNTAALGFIGAQNNQNLGFYGGPAGWGFTYDAINSRVGIGNTNPNAPLAFSPSLGKKITLYPGATGDVGFGVAGNRLQIYSDNPNADVAIGYDAAGVFNERFAVKPTGALAVNGSMGSPGQVLKSNGSGAAASWVGRPSVLSFSQTSNTSNFPPGDLFVPIPGLDNQSFSITETSDVVFNANILVYDAIAIGTAYIYTEVQFLDINSQVAGTARAYGEVAPFRKNNVNVTGMATLAPGFYTTRVVLGKDVALDAIASVRSEGVGKLILEIFPN